ncbi:MAG: hypothetical protein KC731_09235 [Myxococcales bacterium]|nr:hypothetical protein [Myxococcales bacterium]
MTTSGRSFVGYLADRTWVEVTNEGPRLNLQRIEGAPFVELPGATSRAVKRFVGRLLRLSAALASLSPLLLIARLALGPPLGSYATVAFVLLVVGFFALLNAFIVVSVIAFRVAEKGQATLHRPTSLAATSTPPLPSLALPEPGSPLRMRGVVTRLDDDRDLPLVDAWFESPPSRISHLRPFAVVSEEGPPVIVSTRHLPLVAGAGEVTSRSAARAAFPPAAVAMRDSLSIPNDEEAPVELVQLRYGDEVVVEGRVADTIDDVHGFELEGVTRSLAAKGGAVYRGGERRAGVLLGEGRSGPCRIEVLRR